MKNLEIYEVNKDLGGVKRVTKTQIVVKSAILQLSVIIILAGLLVLHYMIGRLMSGREAVIHSGLQGGYIAAASLCGGVGFMVFIVAFFLWIALLVYLGVPKFFGCEMKA